ncbi:protein kinase/lanthionine synthetase C family protein [Rheinheimera sp. YQF-2]|uniref:Protein kinase/lanthionine synthetase C family protein n=1 Tax=Rheinheimera lutimaris TaxID=2740584 RepID=A0A7Y5EK03_9GAMM|nr:class III lanthionine synthetase LanKC [Rheinheimera lutimaris]NRQ44372.1 protein kinase/lanthionine synthetase C family protein [Rheinheimera lutimaris]
MYWIEKRAGRELFNYVFCSSRKYTSIADYRSECCDYYPLVSGLIGSGWGLHYSAGIWAKVLPENYLSVNSGFKIHLSCNSQNGEKMLSAVVPYLLNKRVAFKFIVDRRCHSYVNSQMCTKSASGKFITVYPQSNEEFKNVVRELVALTLGFDGPYILSDKRMEGSKVVFYRFGAFLERSDLNVRAERTQLVQLPSGKWSVDKRTPFFSLPEGVSDPFGDAPEYPAEVIIHNRYRAKGWLGDSNKGGVYLAEDLETGLDVVLKEVRPHINDDADGISDSISLLFNEEKALVSLKDTGVVPQVLDSFVEWENSFLVLEKLPGITLGTLRAQETFSLCLATNPTRERIIEFYQALLDIAEKVLEAIYRAHDAGVYIVDVAPQNFIFDEVSGKVWLIDLEAARFVGDERAAQIGTLGYADNPGQGKPFDAQLDLSAAANVIYNLVCPVNELFPLNPDLKASLLEYISTYVGGSVEVNRFILGISADRDKNLALLAAAKASLAGMKQPQHEACYALQQNGYVQLQKRLAAGIQKNLSVMEGKLDYRPDYRAAIVGDLSLYHGASGILLSLKQSKAEIKPEVIAAYIAGVKATNVQQVVPGLGVGLAGIAKTLMELGELGLATEVLQQALNSELLFDSFDIFYGASGVGLIALELYKTTNEPMLLERAECIAGRIWDELGLEAPDDAKIIHNEEVFSGYYHGASGLACFFTELAELSSARNWFLAAEVCINFELRQAQQHVDGYLTWFRSDKRQVTSPYLRVGAAGIMHALLRCYRHSGNAIYLEACEQAALYLRNKISVTPGYLNGFSGIGFIFIELYEVTSNITYLAEAKRLGALVQLFSFGNEHELSVAGEDSLRPADDLGSGSAGCLLFISRLIGACAAEEFQHA